LQTSPPLCDFEQWIDTEINESDKRLLQGLKEWDAERAEILEKRRIEEAIQKEHKEEKEKRCVAAYREEREKKLEVCAERRQG
jgi:vacuolar-type H+-ATPase subunit I/STV1